MTKQVLKLVRFLKTTAIGGLIFLLPLAVIGALLGYAYNVVLVIYEPLKALAPVTTPTGLALLFLFAVAIVLALCFVCGLAAQWAISQKLSRTIEKRLVMAFPKYAIYKDIVAGNLGGDEHAPSLTPVTVQFQDHVRIAFEAGRTASGAVIVYLPGSPDPWNGSVVVTAAEQVSPLAVDFMETAAICERLGRDSSELLASVPANAALNPSLQKPSGAPKADG